MLYDNNDEIVIMIHTFKASKTKLKSFIFDHNINQSELLKLIEVEALKKNKFPISWATLSRYIHGKVESLRVDFMQQIHDGIQVYIGVDNIEVVDLFDIE